MSKKIKSIKTKNVKSTSASVATNATPMVNIGSVGYTFDGIGMLMIDGKCVDRKEAISVIGCSSEDFDNLMLGNAKGVEESGKILFPNATLAQIQLFCLQQIVATSKAA